MRTYMLSQVSLFWLFATSWTVAHQAPLSTGFSRKGYWSRLLCPPPGDLPGPRIERASPAASAFHGDSFLLNHREARLTHIRHLITTFWVIKWVNQIIVIGRLLSIFFYLKTKHYFPFNIFFLVIAKCAIIWIIILLNIVFILFSLSSQIFLLSIQIIFASL